MARVDAKIVKSTFLNIKTDKGNLKIPLTYIDTAIPSIGNVISLAKTISGEKWHPYTENVSVLAVHSTPFRATEFTDDKGILKGSIIKIDREYYLL